MNEAWDERALWQKARLFLNHAMDADEPRDFDERALWASLALELLAKGALARISPLLIATPNEEGTNLLAASGLVQGSGSFNSVAATTLFTRCARAFRPFDESEAKKIARARNEYLHGGSAVFSPIPEEAWWPSFWAQAAILVHAQDKTLEELVGLDRLAAVDNYLAKNKRNLQQRAEVLILRARQRLQQYRSGDLPSKFLAEWQHPSDLSASLMYSTYTDCPVCGEAGKLEGDTIGSSEMRYGGSGPDDWDTWVELTIYADYFSCATCRIVLDGTDLLDAAGLDTVFVEIGDPPDEPDYGND